MERQIDISKIPKSPRYIYTVDYIFPNPYQSATTFVKRNDNTGFHIQEFYEICVISKGEGYHAIEETVVKAKKGDVFIIPPGRRHALLGGEGFDVHYMHLHNEFIRAYSPRMRELPGFLSLFEIEPMMRASGEVYRHLYLDDKPLKEVMKLIESQEFNWQYDAPSKLIVEAYVLVILTIFCREYEKLQTVVGKNANNDKLFMDSISYVIEHYSENITIEKLSHMAGLARTTYIKRFKEVTGKTPKQFITEQRIKAAKALLLNYDKSITRIAEDVGFYDASHLIKCFIASEGTSPTEYRQQNQGK